ncbi:MAG TPA: peptide ABC transporter substrate-binding protein [Gaiellaceae bacterium]|nr:peptide ABC transporter substrate-binding protein [Gaiellaceae bacterium]
MGKRLWLLVGVVILASVIITTGATAKEAGMSSSKAKTVLVYGAEQDINGFNTNLECCNQFWAVVIGNSPVLRGAWIINSKLQYVPDVITSAKLTASPFTITYNIRKNARWSDGKQVTGADFQWSAQKIVDPASEVAGRDGYDQMILGRTKISNKGKTVKFFFKAPYADWKDLFLPGSLLPKHVLQGEDYNKIWSNCVCNPKNGKPIGNGPYLLQSYRKGTDATLVRNPRWHGPKAKLAKIIFRFIQDTNSEIQAMRGGEVDAIFPSPQTALTALQRQSGIRYQSGPGLYLEHIDLAGKGKHNPLMDKVWFRQAIITGINRGGLVKTFFGDIAPNLKVLNSLVKYPPDAAYKPHFSRWAYSVSKARQLLTSHGCSAGGDGIMTCGGVKASILHTTTGTNRRRVLAAQVYKENLKAIGIDLEIRLVDPNVLFGDGPQSNSAGNWDMAEYAWVTSPDSSFAVPWLACGKPSNNMTYCNRKVSSLLNKSDTTLNATARSNLFNQANALMAVDVPVIPLYAVPVIQVSKNSVKGLGSPNPTSLGPTWNAYAWKF